MDPTKVGVEGLKGLNTEEGRRRELDDYYGFSYSPNEFKQRRASKDIPAPTQEVGVRGLGNSRYDKEITSLSQLEDLNNTRGELQPWYDQIAAGLAKGAVLAGTTFLDGTIGLALGSAKGVASWFDGDPNTGFWNSLWDNEFSKTMKAINEASEKALPNYYTNEELTDPWYKHIISGNFIGDKLIKNIGFTVGAFYGGGVAAAALKATKLPQAIGILTKSMNAPAIVTSGVGATIAAVNEGRIEALNNSTDWYNLQKAKIDDQFGVVNGDTSLLSTTDLELYNAVMTKLNEDRLKMGNMDLALNIPILLASNIIQFGKMYANGFKTAKKTANIVGKAGDYAVKKPSKASKALNFFIKPGSESIEEGSQSGASTISGLAYEQDVNNFYEAKINGEAEQETIDWVKAFSQGLTETLSDGATWEGMFLGYLTAALGVPTFGRVNTSSSDTYLGRNKPIGLRGGILGDISEQREQENRDAEIVSYLNNRVQSPEFENYYQGLIRHNKYQNDMNQAVEDNNEFEFKNAEHAQLVSDIMMFDNAGKLEDLKTLISASYDVSDDNLASIVKNTTSIASNGKLVGPFAEFAVKNEEGGISVNFGNEESKRKMIDKLTQNRDDMLNTITKYSEVKDEIDIMTGQQLTDNQLEELIWLKMQTGNWKDRANQLSSEVKPILNSITGNISQLRDVYTNLKNEEGKAHAGLSDLYREADNKERKLGRVIENIRELTSLNDETFALFLAENPKYVEGIKELIAEPYITISADEVQSTINKVDDIVKLSKATRKFNSKFKEYLDNPVKLEEDIIDIDNTAREKELKKNTSDLKSELLNSSNLTEFRNIIDNVADSSVKENILKELEKENNEIAKNYREVTSYNRAVQRAINNLDESPKVKDSALSLFQNLLNNSNNLQEVSNPNSIYIDSEVLYDDALTVEENNEKFQEARYALSKAMDKVAKDNEFKNRFSADTEIQNEGKPSKTAPEKDTTGYSETTTVPTVDVNNLPDNIVKEDPVGDITDEDIKVENISLNNTNEKDQPKNNITKELRKYYRPAIPELHIEASKEGDFRPFNEVVSERNKGVDFNVLYNYLRDNGTFTYVNEGNLKVGDEIGFMIDPVLEEQMKSYSWYKGPTILLIDKKNNQVVGSLDESSKVVARYEGLSELEKRIKEEYNKNGSTSDKFISKQYTRVSKIMVGKIPYSSESKSLASIPNIKREGKAPIFGVVKNGILFTNGRLADNQVTKPLDMSNKEGRLYLLIPNAAGKYSPAAVRVKHFNRTEFNPEDVKIQNTLIYKYIMEGIEKIASATSEKDLEEAISYLRQYLYIGKKGERTAYIEWITSDKDVGVKITKINRDSDGKRTGKAFEKEISFVNKSTEDIIKEVTDQLLNLNLPIQVNAGMINSGNYNNLLINSNVLTSNIAAAKVIDSWFTTDYIDSEGNVQSAINPVSKRFQERNSSVISGTEITTNNKTIYVDLGANIIRDNLGNDITKTFSEQDKQRYFELAWAQNTYGNATQSALMVDNNVLTPSGKVLNRNTQQYLSEKEAKKIRDRIAGREKTEIDSKKVLAQIADNQKRVDKSRTDSDFYYILEDDNQYHEYERVHKRIGNNWQESTKQEKALDEIKVKLAKLSDNISQFNTYLNQLSTKWKADLESYKGKVDVTSRNAIIDIIRENMRTSNSQRALNAGTSVDIVVRQFFTSNEIPIRPENMSEEAFNSLITTLTDLRSNIEARGERFLTNNIVLFQKYPDGTRIAGEVDILSIDPDGNFRIYDIKTSRYSFYNFTDKYGQKANYFENKSATQIMSAKDYYTLQLSAYKNLFESQYKTPITTLAILPFVLDYKDNKISSVTREKGIMISYNPAVRVPLVNNISSSKTSSSLPIFNSALETQNPINEILPEFNIEGGKVGYYVRDGKLYKSYLAPIGTINGVEMHIAKVPLMTKGYGRAEDKLHVARNSFLAVFPNGNSITLLNDVMPSDSDQKAKDILKQHLSKNPKRVVDMSNEETLIFDPSTTKIRTSDTETSSSILSASSNISNAAKTVQAEQAINNLDEEFEDDIDLGSLRKVDKEEISIWNQEKELKWIKKVLPQLSDNDRVRVVKGLIRAGRQGELAWGQFNKGIITLSDIAAKGTAYHEAFHVVFHLLLDGNERQALLTEAAEMYGSKPALDLEEDMAEGFREYMMDRENRGIGRKILDFFKELFAKVTNWKYLKPSLISYYRMINEGKYAGVYTPYSDISRNREEEYTQEMKDILERAPKDSQGRLLAPNGKPSNLNERQYAQVRTKAFKKWFGDWENNPKEASKVIDENGEPLVVYHKSTSTGFTIFDLSKSKKSREQLHSYSYHFGTEQASKEVNTYGLDGDVFKLFLRIKNPVKLPDEIQSNAPAVLNTFYAESSLDNYGRILSKELFDEGRDLVSDYNTPIEDINSFMIKVFDYMGFDGVVYINNVEDKGSTSYAVLKPNYIKSATDNVGTFNIDNKDIRYRKVPSIKELRGITNNSSTLNNQTSETVLFDSLESTLKTELLNKGWTKEQFDSITQAERDVAIECLPF